MSLLVLVEVGNTLDCQVVALRGSTGEDDLLGISPNQTGNLTHTRGTQGSRMWGAARCTLLDRMKTKLLGIHCMCESELLPLLRVDRRLQSLLLSKVQSVLYLCSITKYDMSLIACCVEGLPQTTLSEEYQGCQPLQLSHRC